MRLLYTFTIKLYHFIVFLASILGNSKAKQWIKGRRGIFKYIATKIGDERLIWVHAASLGEFEQGRPLIEKIKSTFPDRKILLTFFSPSGYEVRKDYEYADYVIYLPTDTINNAKQFIKLVKPELAVFVKYEFWYNYLHQLHKNSIPVYIISAIFREKQLFFKPYGGWFRKQLKAFNHFYVQNKESEKLLEQIGYKNTSVVGDTRFDRVYQLSKAVKSYPLIEEFIEGHKVIMAGSSWPTDEEFLARYANENKDIKFIIAPHVIDDAHLSEIAKRFNDEVLYFTSLKKEHLNRSNILIINTIGHLSSLYQYATIAHIGGGFGKGIHNTLEAATYKRPVTFGPKYHKFQEAKDLIDCNAAFCIKNYEEFRDKYDELLSDNQKLHGASDAAERYVKNSIGATDKIFSDIKAYL